MTATTQPPATSRSVVAAVVFAISLAAFTRIPLLPDIGDDLHLSAADLGVLTAGFGLGRLVMDLPAGRLSDAVSPATSLAASGLGLAAACTLFAAARSMELCLIASTLIGCASALTNTTGMYAFATTSDATRRGASMAIYATALMSGQTAGPIVGGALGSLTGWRGALVVSASIGVAVALVCAVARRREPATARSLVAEGAAEDSRLTQATSAREQLARVSAPSVLELVAISAVPFATFFALGGLTQTIVPLIGDQELGFSASSIGIAIGIGGASRFLGAWVAGVVSDKVSRKVVLVPCLLTMALGSVILALPPSPAGWVVGIVLLALGSSGTSVAAATLADRVPRERLGRDLGVFRLIGDAGLLAGPIVAGVLYQVSGAAIASASSAVVSALAAFAAAAWIRDPGGLRGTGGAGS